MLGLLLVRASGLTRRDGGLLGQGLSDPYVVAKLGSHVMGTTQVLKRTLDPCWMETVSTLISLERDARLEDVTLEVWGWNALSKHEFLGEAAASQRSFMEQADRVLTLPLCGRPGMGCVSGTITIHVHVLTKVVLEVLSSKILPHGRGKDTTEGLYCAAHWTGREPGEVLRTSTLQSQSPCWDERFVLAVPVRFPPDALQIEIRRHAVASCDSLVGKIRIDACTLLSERSARCDPPSLRYALQGCDDDDALSQPFVRCEKRRPASFLIKDSDRLTTACSSASGGARDEDAGAAAAATDNPLRFEEDQESIHEKATKAQSSSKKRSSMMPRCVRFFASRRSKGAAYCALEGEDAVAIQKKTSALSEPGQIELLRAAPATRQETTSEDEGSNGDSELEDSSQGGFLTIRVRTPAQCRELHVDADAEWRARPSQNVLQQMSCELEVLRCDDLPRADLLGRADPFVECWAGGAFVRKTSVARHTLSPKWCDERFALPAFKTSPTGANDLTTARVELRVLDWDAIGPPSFLGHLAIEHASLLAHQHAWRTLPLGPDPLAMDTAKKVSTKTLNKQRGTLTFRVAAVAHVRVTVLSAYGLRAGVVQKKKGSSTNVRANAYAQVRYLGAVQGSASAVRNEASPRWYHAIEMSVKVPVGDAVGEAALVEVWDCASSSPGKGDVLLGVAEVPQDALCFPHDSPGVRALYSSETKELAGWVQLVVETSSVPGVCEPRRRADERPRFKEARDPRTDRRYWFDATTGERFWEDPRPASELLKERLEAYERSCDHESLQRAPPVALRRAQKGFPESPEGIACAGQSGAAKVWWLPNAKQNGPCVHGYTVERQRKLDCDTTTSIGQTDPGDDDDAALWQEKGSVYVASRDQALCDVRQALKQGASVDARNALFKRVEQLPPPTAVIVDALSNVASYRFRVSAHNAVGKSSPSRWSNATRVREPLPEGWTEIFTVDCAFKSYFFNVKTGQSTWERPETDPFYLPTKVFLKFSEDEIAHLQRVFTDADQDKSKAISLREFEQCLPPLGEQLAPTDALWLFYQADLDFNSELSYCNFATAIDTLKKARLEHAPASRRLGAWATEQLDYATRPRVAKAKKALLEYKLHELSEQQGHWTHTEHPELTGQTYWLNRETGEASYETPRQVQFFLPRALRTAALQHYSHQELKDLEHVFSTMDLDGSGNIDAAELKLLVKKLTGQHLSAGRCRGLVKEVDVDQSGLIDFDEFVLILVSIKDTAQEGTVWSKLSNAFAADEDDQRTATQDSTADIFKTTQDHGHYCVCGCRAIPLDLVHLKRRRKAIFPKLNPQQLRRQAATGGAGAAAAVGAADHADASKYTAAQLVAVHTRASAASHARSPPRWSSLHATCAAKNKLERDLGLI